jgi:hypothetical protein
MTDATKNPSSLPIPSVINLALSKAYPICTLLAKICATLGALPPLERPQNGEPPMHSWIPEFLDS